MLDSAWSFLDQKYGNTIKLSNERVGDLERFYYSEEARTDGDALSGVARGLERSVFRPGGSRKGR